MGKDERKELVLPMLVESEMALAPKAIFRNLKIRGATFEERTTVTYLNELVDEGLVKRVSAKKLDKGEIVTAEKGEEGYYMATDEALRKVE